MNKDIDTVNTMLKMEKTKSHLFEIMKTAIYYNNNVIVDRIFWLGYDINEEPKMELRTEFTLIHESDKGYVVTPHLIYASCLNRM